MVASADSDKTFRNVFHRRSLAPPRSSCRAQDAAAIRDTPKREHHRVDLVRIGVDATLALRSRITPPLAGPSKTNEVLGVVAAVDGVHVGLDEGGGSWAVGGPAD